MTNAVEDSVKPRWTRALRTPETLAEDLGLVGVSVGPRTGPNKRNHGEKEDYVLRRLLTAEKQRGRLNLPAELRAAPENGLPREPDFLVVRGGETIGIEITEAGEQDYQSWLTQTENLKSAGRAIDLPLEASSERTVSELVRSIESKVKKYDRGHYRSTPQVHLVVYDNTAWGGYLDKRDLVRDVRSRNDLSGRFEQVHIVFQSMVVLDVFETPDFVDISSTYETDYAGWIAVQAERLRQGKTHGLDLSNIAAELEDLGKSERRALASHLRNLMLHLLKFQFQPDKRTRSWSGSIINARADLEELLTESPSLRSELAEVVLRQYRPARQEAAAETGLPIETFPAGCPYTPRQLVDDEFFPGQ